MRLSIDRTDPGFRPAVVRHEERYDVLLDGERIADVVTADEAEGLVLTYARDEEGGFRHRDGELVRVAHRGAVEIVRAR